MENECSQIEEKKKRGGAQGHKSFQRKLYDEKDYTTIQISKIPNGLYIDSKI